MAETLSPTQRKFLETYVTGLAAPKTASPEPAEHAAFDKAWRSARETWQKTSDGIDRQISALQSALKSSDDPELREIGELGLNAITGNRRVRMMAAIREIDTLKGAPDKSQIAQLAGAIKDFEGHVASDSRIAACDNNPFGVDVSIGKSVTAALSQMKSALRVGLSSVR